MKRIIYKFKVFTWTVSLGLTACINHSSKKEIPNKNTKKYISVDNQHTKTVERDSLNLQKENLTKIYDQAIQEFIKSAYKYNKTTFDTLYFGKRVNGQPDDFPNIELPEKIENVHIRLVTPEQGEKLMLENKNRKYVNLVGFIEREKAEFIFVVFSDGLTHQYDYFLNFYNNSSTNKFELDKIDFENYLQSDGQKPKRISIFKERK